MLVLYLVLYKILVMCCTRYQLCKHGKQSNFLGPTAGESIQQQQQHPLVHPSLVCLLFFCLTFHLGLGSSTSIYLSSSRLSPRSMSMSCSSILSCIHLWLLRVCLLLSHISIGTWVKHKHLSVKLQIKSEVYVYVFYRVVLTEPRFSPRNHAPGQIESNVRPKIITFIHFYTLIAQ